MTRIVNCKIVPLTRLLFNSDFRYSLELLVSSCGNESFLSDMATRVVSKLPARDTFSLLFHFDFTDVTTKTVEEKQNLQMSLLNLIRVYYVKHHGRMLENCMFDLLHTTE